MTPNSTGFRPVMGDILDNSAVFTKHDAWDEGQRLKLEQAIADAAEKYFVGNKPGVVIKMESPFDMDPVLRRRLQIREEISQDLHMNIDWEEISVKDQIGWNGFDLWVMEREAAGESWYNWWSWWKSDDFRAKNQVVYLTPKKIKKLWPMAYEYFSKRNKETPNPSDRFAGLEFVPAPTK